ncbi:MFS transporter [Speluncibacter jeojiensis]|uniref:MFS transporter n=1 Tax=Speluncibacter jeojiensis TaxID=2710754 RepID=A0A9X4M6G0_9ACTN|nr:MFS transporter [Corynebacteriales bacterium D3-21]
MTATLDRQLDARTPGRTRPWWILAAAMFVIAWGGNQFTPLLSMYRMHEGLSTTTVDVLLFAYVLGIIPAMLLGGPLSDRFGRRPLMLPAPVIGIVGSLVLSVGAAHEPVLFVGRVLSGLALGLMMAVGSSWMKELSGAPWDPDAAPGTGARRAAMSMTAGFAIGAVVAGLLAEWGPWPGTLPYLVHVVLSVPVAVALLRTPETRAVGARGTLLQDLRIPAAAHRRFWYVVIPVAPWVFGAAGAAYAVLPNIMVDRAGAHPIAFSALLCLIALGCGFGIQALGRRIDTPRSARAVAVALGILAVGCAIGAVAARELTIPLAVAAAAVLGAGYGMALVSGLQEIQRIAGPDDLAGLTAVFYSLSYLGFGAPAVMAVLSGWVSYPAMFGFGVIVAVASLALVAWKWAAHLPEPQGPAVVEDSVG